MTVRKRIEISGIVQGVGFRPHVYRLANRYQLTGQVRNTSAGVTVEVQGDSVSVQQFVRSVGEEAPPLARITSIFVADQNCKIEDGFHIILSEQGQSPDTLIAPDIATCGDCLRELFDTRDRRYGYPFINCTNCGPRFTILRCIPYDRPNTSMAAFPMCSACQVEYDDPLNRRFHAQPNACWSCGPQLRLLDVHGYLVAGDPIELASECLRAGKVIAIKGLGGFHLSVDATNTSAVERLRLLKMRFEKPFAVMVADLDMADEFCIVSEDDRNLLESYQRPIVLLRARENSELPAIAPGNPELGLFLPYTPIQHLLFARGRLSALVMTSANLSEEPICIDNDEAVARLRGIPDFFLVHNRDILLRCDDSVARTSRGQIAMLRRSRGFVPVPISLDCELAPVLAVGGELKNAICITKGNNAFIGQHVGDLENLAAFRFFQESIAHFQNILRVQPEVIAYDLHPGYLSTHWAVQQQGIKTVAVQHHHAHVASCMAENHISGQVIGIVLDGAGYGTDAQIWGGEILVANFQGFYRAARFEYVSMPGGAQAIREPWRMALSQLIHADRLKDGLPFLQRIPAGHLSVVQQMVEQQIRSPLTSSCGRLFDAVAALIGLRTVVTYEGQAAIELEACCEGYEDEGEYTFTRKGGECIEIGTALLFSQIVEDLCKSISQGTISLRFHKGLATALADAVREVAMDTGIRSVCLTGGCFQNQLLHALLIDRLQCHGLLVFWQSQVPSGDGGLSLGQALIAAHAI